jgi:hypothetical protein
VGIDRKLDVTFDYGSVDTQTLAVFQAELDGGLDHRLIDGLQGGWGEPEGAVESIMLGHTLAVEVRKSAQSIAVVDAFAQFAIIPVLDA